MCWVTAAVKPGNAAEPPANMLDSGTALPVLVYKWSGGAERAWQPLAGWHGHAAPFAFEPGYQPAPGIQRYLCGTPPVLAMAALECGVDTLLAAQPLGGMAALRRKSLALTRLFIDEVRSRCADHGLRFVSPDEDARRGSQVSFAHPHGYRCIGKNKYCTFFMSFLCNFPGN